MVSLPTLCALVVVMVAPWVQAQAFREYCKRRFDPCWPDDQAFRDLQYSLDGAAVMPSDSQYSRESRMKSVYYQKNPGMIVKVKSIRDVQRSLAFVRRYNLQLTIFSSGHDFNGRSTETNSLQISMALMQKIDVKLYDRDSDTGASVTVQTGNSWKRIYEEMDKVGKIVVGGSSHTVSPGGYTAGGGHSPLSRSLGLAVDNLLAVTLIVANGSVAQLYPWGTNLTDPDGKNYLTSNTDLFWAISGGGGGTFGIVIDYKFKIHDPPEQLVQFMAMYPLDIHGDREPGRKVIRHIHSQLATLPNEWGGYILHFPRGPTTPVTHELADAATGYIFVFLLHYGPWNTLSRKAIAPLAQFRTDFQLLNVFVNHSSFWSYEKTVIDASEYYLSYVANSLIPESLLTHKLADFYMDTVLDPPYVAGGAGGTCTEVLIGGEASIPGDDAISEGFRNALISSTCSLVWVNPDDYRIANEFGEKMAERFYEHASGVYLNEPAYHLPNWESDFWGHKYDRLLSIKDATDPHRIFYCHHCVGDVDTPILSLAPSYHHINSTMLVVIVVLALFSGLN